VTDDRMPMLDSRSGFGDDSAMATTAVGGEATAMPRTEPSVWSTTKADPADWFEPETVAKSKTYMRPLRIVGRTRFFVMTAVELALIGFGFYTGVANSVDVGWFPTLLLVSVVAELISLPVSTATSAWRELSYDKKWGFSNQTPKGFVLDLLKSMALGFVLSTVITGALWWIIRSTDLWWLGGAAVLAGISVVLGILYPVAIAPIFNKFKPLDNEQLHDDLLALARRTDADIEKVLVMDASKRDTRGNAYVAGLGKTRRVVLFDTMLEYPQPELEAVIAHEIGHWKLRHLLRTIPFMTALIFVQFALVAAVLSWDPILDFANVDDLGDPAALPIFMLVFGVLSTLTGIASSWYSRAKERQADQFSMRITGDATSMMGGLARLHTQALADLAPSWWKRIQYSHPPVAERLQFCSEWADANGVAWTKPEPPKVEEKAAD
jgi:STE24 endopeptidase